MPTYHKFQQQNLTFPQTTSVFPSSKTNMTFQLNASWELVYQLEPTTAKNSVKSSITSATHEILRTSKLTATHTIKS